MDRDRESPPRLPRRAHIGGNPPDPALEVESIPKIDSGRDAANTLLTLPDRPTAIFAFNDNIAIGALQAARARGLRIPTICRSSASTTSSTRRLTPALTTVRQPLAEWGRTAVSLLSRFLDGQSFETLHAEQATCLVDRDSTAPPKKT